MVCGPFGRAFAAVCLCAGLAACSAGPAPDVGTKASVFPFTEIVKNVFRARRDRAVLNPKVAVANGFRVMEEADPTLAAVPDPQVLEQYAHFVRGGGRYHVGQPYEIAGQLYQPQEDPTYDHVGRASWYGAQFHGRLTANGEIFDSSAITAAHPTLPLPSYVRVTNLANKRSIVVRVNDRGPYSEGRLIDVSEQTAALLGFRRRGTTKVRVEYVERAPLRGDDKATLLATYHGPQPVVQGVQLASAPATPPATDALAFLSEPQPGQAEAAMMRRLTVTLTAAERILMAFQASEEAEK